MDIKVLGTGCSRCKSLESVTKEAVDQSGIKATVSRVEDITEIMQYGVMNTPALVVDGKVILKGRVPKLNELMELLNHHK